MPIFNQQLAKAAGQSPCLGWFRYFVNGTTDPVLASCVGPLARYLTSLTYSATGKVAIVFTTDFAWGGALAFNLNCSHKSGTIFDVKQMGAYVAATRTLNTQAVNGALVANAPAADADAFVDVWVYGDFSASR